MNTLLPGLQRESVMARGLIALGMVGAVWAASALGSQAHARGDVYWSIGVNGPGVSIGASNAPAVVYQPPTYYYPPQPVVVRPPPTYYYPPQQVVVRPPPVYYHPPAVVYAPPVVVAPPRPVVISGYGYWNDRPHRGYRDGHHHGHRHHRHRDRDDD